MPAITAQNTFIPTKRERHGVWARLKLPASQGTRLISAITQGFEVTVVDAVQRELDAPQKVVLEIAGISTRTLARRKKEGRLSTDESDRIASIAAVISAAEGLFEGDHKTAMAWITSPVKGLGGEIPLRLLKTEAGTRDVIRMIERLEQGVFS